MKSTLKQPYCGVSHNLFLNNYPHSKIVASRIARDVGRAIAVLCSSRSRGGLLLPPLGIAKKEIMQMRRLPSAVAPLNAGPFAVSCNVRIPKGFPARPHVRSFVPPFVLSLSLSQCTQKGFPW